MVKFHGVNSLAKLYASEYNTTTVLAEERIREFKHILALGLLDEDYQGVQLMDTITLKKVVRKGKVGRNPKTKEETLIPARIGIKAELGKKLFTDLGNE
ncbi:MAG: HU family DNA-binding protein [Peptostreptococcaceae bacterium]